MAGQSLGPVIGGVLAQFLGWHAIFWFLFITGSVSLVSIITLLPETLRRIGGNGSIRLRGFHKPLVHDASQWTSGEIPAKAPLITLRHITRPLEALSEKDIFVTLLFGSFVYAFWSMVTTSTTSIFIWKYKYSESVVGLLFLPNGIGCILGSYITGRIMDRDYRKVEAEFMATHSLEPGTGISLRKRTDFPIEKARLRSMWWITATFITAMACYGPSLKLPNPAMPLVLQFMISFTATSTFSMNSALMIDFYPGSSASATAVNNFVRCSVGATGVSVIQPLINSVGTIFAFPILAGITLALTPLIMAEWKWGEKWRAARIAKAEAKAETKAEAKAEGKAELKAESKSTGKRISSQSEKEG